VERSGPTDEIVHKRGESRAIGTNAKKRRKGGSHMRFRESGSGGSFPEAKLHKYTLSKEKTGLAQGTVSVTVQTSK